MRDAMWEYLIPSLSEKEDLWEKCIFVFDANVLLNLYRYTSNTRDALLAAFDDLKDRIWLPHQVVYEFAKNRFEVIFETVEKYKKLETLEHDFLSQYKTELRIKDTDQSIVQLQQSIDSWISEQKRKNLLVTNASDDKILEKLLTIFSGKVGTAFSKEEMDKVSKEGKERYEKQIPPGFCDSKKEKDASENNAYGDLVVWKQILDYSSSGHYDIIFVTHDQKKDWWLISKGRTVGPRIELRKEFAQVTNQSFYMYSMENFIEHYSKNKGQTADRNVLDEVIQIDNVSKRNKKAKKPSSLNDNALRIEQNIFSIQGQIARRQRTVEHLRYKYKDRSMPPNVITQIYNTENKIAQLQHQLSIKRAELLSAHNFNQGSN